MQNVTLIILINLSMVFNIWKCVMEVIFKKKTVNDHYGLVMRMSIVTLTVLKQLIHYSSF